ncbi:hypothetical protein PE067_14470 [Paracoccus sp. DMF-8]|uniref:hypothetical protein n=1 Tax=Paracoccus sp. DMF-8 TaxID=3019445 RepID=UPI0023E38AF7|nr:hypothetical protein [Paracoccus sp. DMF-8]MDF3607223.1 hypothetical protein [Paracoccus sp. DMF-8]
MRATDLNLRLQALRNHPAPHSAWSTAPPSSASATMAARLRRLAPEAAAMSPGAMAALAYPDRIGLRRKGDEARYVLSGGKGARAGRR